MKTMNPPLNDDVLFHDSLDRLLSSYSTSSSNSDDEDFLPISGPKPIPGPTYGPNTHHSHHFTPNSGPKLGPNPNPNPNGYDVWISQPFSSVEERRKNLLRHLGISNGGLAEIDFDIENADSVSERNSFCCSDRNGIVCCDDVNSCGEGDSEIRSDDVCVWECMGESGCGEGDSEIRNGDVRVWEGMRENGLGRKGIVSCNGGDSVGISSEDRGVGECMRVNGCGEGDSDVRVWDRMRENGSDRKGIVSCNGSDSGVNSCGKGECGISNEDRGVRECMRVNGLANKPPVVKIGLKEMISSDVMSQDVNRNDKGDSGILNDDLGVRECMSGNSRSGSCSRGVGEGLEGNGEVREEDLGCLIKDLDNGKEFVVNEVKEDGSWNRLKEVGTGRQLTMEEFEKCVGTSPIVQELMRRQSVEEGNRNSSESNVDDGGGSGSYSKKKGSWLKSIRNVASSVRGYREKCSSDERDTSSEKGGRRSSSATDDSQDGLFHGPERVRVRQYGKCVKELTALYRNQEIQAHKGSIWSMKFSLDGKYLASAGEDCVIHVWQVMESERKGDLLFDKPEDGNLNLLFLTNGSQEPTSMSPSFDGKRRKGRSSISRKSVSLEHILVPETVFALSDKPFCSFEGHMDDVLDLSWSKSQFNPVNDRYFISGSLDGKVRVWSVPERQVVDWYDLHEMVTSACYTPDGQGALVGSYKGSCRLFSMSEHKLQKKCQINLQNKKKKSNHKKITGFQFVPGSSSEVLITSADSRIRVVESVDLIHKFKGFHNTNSQISASITANGKYVVCASEDSNVYVWKHEGEFRPSRTKGVTVTPSYEYFQCRDVSMATPWPGMSDSWGAQDSFSAACPTDRLDSVLTANHPPTPVEHTNSTESSRLKSNCSKSPVNGTMSTASKNYFIDRISATWPEEKLLLATKHSSPRVSVDFTNGLNQSKSAWGMVIVTAGLRGEIKTFQNFGLPVRI